MKGLYLLFVLLLSVVQCYAQNTLKGYVNPEANIDGRRELILTRLLPGQDLIDGVVVARGRIQEDGSFSFNDSVFTKQDAIYSVQMEISSPGKKILDTTINDFRSFILSNRDSVRFTYGNSRISGYYTTNEGDKEWQKLKEYEEQITAEENLDPGKYLAQTRNYTKDSLQILLVKLLSIKTLDEKQLLEKDIKENANFYLDLLQKLHSSDLDPASYTYLENKIRATHQDLISRKYRISLALNFFGFSGIVSLLFVVFRMRKNFGTACSVPLSRQEENIKNLILQGKTNKEIAGELFISVSTVKTHISNIYSKLNVSNRKDLTLKNQIHTGTST